MEEDARQLRILLLGSPRVFYDEQEIHIKRRLLRALFFYLASQPNPVGRSVLMDLFWPEESEEDARRHIREALSKLRSELPDPSLIVATQDHVRLDTERVYVDLLEYQALVEQVRPYVQRGMHTPLPEAIYQQMVKAVNLWRGTEFLAGANLPSTDGLDHWLSLTSQSLSFSHQNLLETLSEHCAVSGDLENAVHWMRKAVQLDEENPDLYYQLIQWLHEIGRVKYLPIKDDEALESFQTLSRLEGIIPALESAHALAEAIKRAPTMRKDQIILVNLSGRGDKDLNTVIGLIR